MTFVKYFLAEIITNLFCCNRRHLERALGYQFPALATLIYVDSGDCSPCQQVNGPPRALPSKSVDHMSANIVFS